MILQKNIFRVFYYQFSYFFKLIHFILLNYEKKICIHIPHASEILYYIQAFEMAASWQANTSAAITSDVA